MKELRAWQTQHDKREWDGGWLTQSQANWHSSGEWMHATVPGTVLASLVLNGVFPDPYYSLNMKDIPDISDVGAEYYTYWFRTSFDVDQDRLQHNQRVFLRFRGLNYRATVFLNGQQLNATHGHAVEGMFLRHEFDVSAMVQRINNMLAVRIEPVDNPGVPGGQGGNQEIGKDVTAQYSAGWDWVAATPDRMTGIWDLVTVEYSGAAYATQPHVVTRVRREQDVLLEVTAVVVNDMHVTVSGTLSATITDPDTLHSFRLASSVSVSGGQETLVRLDEYEWRDAKLWWPHGYGAQPLYQVDVEFHSDDDLMHNSVSLRMGVREVSSEIMEVGAGDMEGRVFKVNGRRIFIRGANWIGTDLLMRYQADKTRYHTEVRMHREMNMNMIRIWGGGYMERPEFYDACDELGLLVFQEFWMTGDVNGLWGGEHDYPLDHGLFMRSVEDSVMMLRNHPSLLLWCGGNEVAPKDVSPPMDIQLATRALIEDPDVDGTRLYLPSSMNLDMEEFDNEVILAPYDGPYGVQPVSFFFGRHVNKVVFNPEVGNVGVPVFESLRRFMSPDDLDDFPEPATDADGGTVTVGEAWEYHTYIKYSVLQGEPETDRLYAYGDPRDAEEYTVQAQLVNFDQYRAILEGYQAHMWHFHTGVLLWKSQNPWPGLRGSAYDWYLDQNAAFYGMRLADEMVHVQLFEPDWSMQVVNVGFDTLRLHTVDYELFDKFGGSLANDTVRVLSINPSSVHTLQEKLEWPPQLPHDETLFVRLALRDAGGALVSTNTYWRSHPSLANPSFRDLQQLRRDPSLEARVQLAATVTPQHADSQWHIEVDVTNAADSPALAFFVRLEVHTSDTSADDTRVLPSWYSDNYFTLKQGESTTVDITCSFSDAGGDWSSPPFVAVSAWNVPWQRVTSDK